MKLYPQNILTGGVFSVLIKFKSYDVFEEGLMEDFGVPELIIPVSTCKSKVEIQSGKFVVTDIGPNTSGDNCSIDINTEIVTKLNETFEVKYSIAISDIDDSNLSSPLDSVVKVAEAKCATFVKLIEKEANAKMNKLRAMKTDFEAAIRSPEVIRV